MSPRHVLARARSGVIGRRCATAALLALLVGAGACGSADHSPPARPAVARSPDASVAADAGAPDAGAPDEAVFTEKHLVFDDDLDGGAIPHAHTDRRWGNYLDKQGKPAVGWHSHDPVTGNAQ